MNKGIFITGTDTGVGKTVVACGFAKLMTQHVKRVGVMKPVATGDQEDAKQLIRASGTSATLEYVNPMFFKEPLAPSVSAALENRVVDLERIYKAYWALSKESDVMIVEGAGGVKTPLGESTYMADLIGALRLRAVIVAHAGLGTINHTLLTLEALERANVAIAGVILNGYTGKTLAERTNLEALRTHTAIDIYGTLPQSDKLAKNPTATAALLAPMPGVQRLVKRLCEKD